MMKTVIKTCKNDENVIVWEKVNRSWVSSEGQVSRTHPMMPKVNLDDIFKSR